MYDLCSHTTPCLVMVVCEWRYGEDTTCLMCSLECVSQQLKISLRPRKYHMSCSYHKQERQTDVFLFGGNKQRKSKFDRHVMTGLTIFHFGEQWSVQSYSNMTVVKKSCTSRLSLTGGGLWLKTFWEGRNFSIQAIYTNSYCVNLSQIVRLSTNHISNSWGEPERAPH